MAIAPWKLNERLCEQDKGQDDEDEDENEVDTMDEDEEEELVAAA